MTTQVAQRFQTSDVLRIFPSFVWKAELRPEVHERINDSILRTLGEIDAPLADLRPVESWQSDHGLHEQREFRELVDCINEAAYPRDLFEIQVDKLNTYHMTVPQVFYNREDVWVPPKERYGGETALMEPYYVLIRLPGENRLQFLLMMPVTPSNRDNMIASIAARLDAPGYGEVIVYKLSKDSLLLGPLQVEAMIDQDTTISRQLTLWDQHGSHVIRGNLLVIPIEHSFLYVEPVFMLAEGANIPQLKRVIVSDGAGVAMESGIAEALRVLFGQKSSPSEDATGTPEAAIPGAREAFSRSDQALRQGDWSTFGREWEQLKNLLEK